MILDDSKILEYIHSLDLNDIYICSMKRIKDGWDKNDCQIIGKISPREINMGFLTEWNKKYLSTGERFVLFFQNPNYKQIIKPRGLGYAMIDLDNNPKYFLVFQIVKYLESKLQNKQIYINKTYYGYHIIFKIENIEEYDGILWLKKKYNKYVDNIENPTILIVK